VNETRDLVPHVWVSFTGQDPDWDLLHMCRSRLTFSLCQVFFDISFQKRPLKETYMYNRTFSLLQVFLIYHFKRNPYPLHSIKFCPPKFFSKTFNFSIIFYSTLQISGGGPFRKACRSRKKESKPSEITCKQSEPARTLSKIEKRREF